jgi:hypothetical protein
MGDFEVELELEPEGRVVFDLFQIVGLLFHSKYHRLKGLFSWQR